MAEQKRVVRIIEYHGNAEHVDQTIARSVQGTVFHGGTRITAATIGGENGIVVAELLRLTGAHGVVGTHLGQQNPQEK